MTATTTRNRRLTWAVWAIGLVSGCGGTSDPEPIASVDGWEIESSTPTFTGASVSASFDAHGEGSRAFGACLVADLHSTQTCETAADCATEGAVVTLAMGHFQYCLAAAGEAKKTCWTRNGGDVAWCNKVPPPGRVEGTYATPAVEAAQIADSGSKTRWMALACLNAGTYPAFSDGPLPPCVSTDPAAADYKAYATSKTATFSAP